MKHKDEDRHDADGKKKQVVEGDELMAPEVPFRIKAIYDYLRTYPEEDPLLSQMQQLSMLPADWHEIFL